MSMLAPSVGIQAELFDVAAEIAQTTAGLEGRAGAVVTFTGLCRDEGGRLEALEIEHYPGMAEAEIFRTAQRAMERWPLVAETGAASTCGFWLLRSPLAEL